MTVHVSTTSLTWSVPGNTQCVTQADFPLGPPTLLAQTQERAQGLKLRDRRRGERRPLKICRASGI